MRYTEEPGRATELIEGIEAELARERADKTDDRPHVSDMVYCLRRSWRLRQAKLHPELHPTWKKNRDDENSRLILLIGQALHTIVAKADGRTPNQRLETDWLVGEADARLVSQQDSTIIEEFKTARAGMSEDDPLHWPHYLNQVASYIVLAQEMGFPISFALTEPNAVLHVLHITFNTTPKLYKPHPRQLKKESDDAYLDRLYKLQTEARLTWEQKMADWLAEQGQHSNLRSWPLYFSENEIQRWRVELLRRSKILMGTVEPGVDECAPTNGSHGGLSWECGYCPFLVANGGDCPGGPGRSAEFFPIDKLTA